MRTEDGHSARAIGASSSRTTKREDVMEFTRTSGAIVALSLIGLLFAPAAEAQFEQGQRRVGVHVGLSGVGSAASIGASGEVAYTDRISVGAWADTWSYGESYAVIGDRYSWDVRYIAVAGTGAYHFPIEGQPKLDPFAGLSLGYFIVNTEASGPFGVSYTGDSSRIFFGGFGGVRYSFQERLSGEARLGFGASHLTLGLSYRL
jgi:hypothetical protein